MQQLIIQGALCHMERESVPCYMYGDIGKSRRSVLFLIGICHREATEEWYIVARKKLFGAALLRELRYGRGFTEYEGLPIE